MNLRLRGCPAGERHCLKEESIVVKRHPLLSLAARMSPVLAILAAASAGFGLAPPVVAQDANGVESGELSNEQLLEDYIHFVLIRNDELALSYANALLDRGISPREFVGLVEDSPTTTQRFEKATRLAILSGELEQIAAMLDTLYEEGRLAQARDPEEISRNIALLGESPRARLLAAQRLMEAGEYAVPQLLEVILARSNQPLETQVEKLLTEMGGDAAMPLSVALPGVDNEVKPRLARILGQIGRTSALPYLYDTMRSSGAEPVREETARAIRLIQGSPADQRIATSELYWQLGERHFSEERALLRFPGESHQIVWGYEPGLGLVMTPVRTEAYHPTMSMLLSERALAEDPDHQSAKSLWIAANFKREIESAEGYENPVYGPERPAAKFYAIMAGSETTQRVLARALDDRDTPLARRAIEALAPIVGDASLWQGLGERKPLLDALRYPDRRVQYEAALALGRAKPVSEFAGSDRVTPLLASAVRDASKRYALAFSRDVERQQELAELLRNEGYEIIQTGATLSDAASGLAEAVGVDMIVTDLRTEETLGLIDRARSNPKLSVTPILALLPGSGWLELRRRYENNPLTDVARTGLDDEQLANAIERLAVEATGEFVTEEEARQYAMQALDVLRELAISRNPVFNVADATLPLIGALGETEGLIQLRVADVLARVDSERAQRALMDEALDSTGEERVALFDRVAESGKSFGNMLEDRQVRYLLSLASEGDGEQATAAAALVGALSISNTEVVPLILGRS